MRHTILLASTLLAACASQAPRDTRSLVAANATTSFTATAEQQIGGATNTAPATRAAADETPRGAEAAVPGATSASTDAASSDTFTATRTVTSDEADNGRVCEYRMRPGSHIAQKYCYTRDQRIANQEARDEIVRQQIDELQREQRLQDEMRRQMEMERMRRRSAFGN